MKPLDYTNFPICIDEKFCEMKETFLNTSLSEIKKIEYRRDIINRYKHKIYKFFGRNKFVENLLYKNNG